MPTIKPNQSEKIINLIFKGQDVVYGLKEFAGIDISKILYINEKEPHRFYVKDLKTGHQKFVYDDRKQTGKPEEVIRQLWLYQLHTRYKYPFDRIDTEKTIHFGREIHAKAADIIVYKRDKITPFIIVEVKSPTEKKALNN